jgi:hypothetical protein
MTNHFLRGFLNLEQIKVSPNKHKAEVGRKGKTRGNGFLEYAAIVHSAKLEARCKDLFQHYGYAYNWKKQRASFYTQDQICALTSMSKSTYQKARRKLSWHCEGSLPRATGILLRSAYNLAQNLSYVDRVVNNLQKAFTGDDKTILTRKEK